MAEHPDPDTAVGLLPCWTATARDLLHGPGVGTGGGGSWGGAAEEESWLGEEEAQHMQVRGGEGVRAIGSPARRARCRDRGGFQVRRGPSWRPHASRTAVHDQVCFYPVVGHARVTQGNSFWAHRTHGPNGLMLVWCGVAAGAARPPALLHGTTRGPGGPLPRLPGPVPSQAAGAAGTGVRGGRVWWIRLGWPGGTGGRGGGRGCAHWRWQQ